MFNTEIKSILAKAKSAQVISVDHHQMTVGHSVVQLVKLICRREDEVITLSMSYDKRNSVLLAIQVFDAEDMGNPKVSYQKHSTRAEWIVNQDLAAQYQDVLGMMCRKASHYFDLMNAD